MVAGRNWMARCVVIAGEVARNHVRHAEAQDTKIVQSVLAVANYPRGMMSLAIAI